MILGITRGGVGGEGFFWKLTTELLAALRDLLGVEGLDLGAAGLLLGLELEALHVLAGGAHADPRGLEGPVRLLLGRLGRHDALTRLHDGRVQLDAAAAVAVPERPLQ